jgi:hypothetical protein
MVFRRSHVGSLARVVFYFLSCLRVDSLPSAVQYPVRALKAEPPRTWQAHYHRRDKRADLERYPAMGGRSPRSPGITSRRANRCRHPRRVRHWSPARRLLYKILFRSLAHTRAMLEAWRANYNTIKAPFAARLDEPSHLCRSTAKGQHRPSDSNRCWIRTGGNVTANRPASGTPNWTLLQVMERRHIGWFSIWTEPAELPNFEWAISSGRL